jgi:signal transduction histidine kinase
VSVSTPVSFPSFAVRPRPPVVAVRALMFALVAILVLADGFAVSDLLWLGLLLLAWIVATFSVAPLAVFGRLAEITVTVLAASSMREHAGSILPYLVVPVVAAALRESRTRAYAYLGGAVVLLVVFGAIAGVLDERAYAIPALAWTVVTGIAAFQAGHLKQAMLGRPALDEVRALAPSSRAAVLSGSGGGRLVVLAQVGVERVDWETALDTESAIADAWATQQPVTANRSQSRSKRTGDISSLVIPLIAGVRTIGLIVLEDDSANAYPPALIGKITAITGPAALRLEAALLFDEVRSLATTEERQRLAREIHDGVAQELVMVGYGIDNAVAALPDSDAAAEELRILRAEVTRVITELRLSLFELRSEVDRYGGLTAAIADYARTVAASAGFRVHLSLDESTARLPAAIEAELLRIAQEAITNARKHAGAENLWVTCAVDPPFAQVEISDDGGGIGDQRPDGHYGLAIMAERAERIRGRLEITPRMPSGTTVAVVLGTAPRGR